MKSLTPNGNCQPDQRVTESHTVTICAPVAQLAF